MKKKIIFLSIFILLLAIGGVGIYYFTQTNRKPVVWADEEAMFQTYTAPAPTDGTTPLDHDSYDNIAYVLWMLEHTKQYSSLTEGTAVSVGQTQTIYNHRRVNGDEQLVDTISGGLVSLGKQKYFLDNKVLIRDYISKKDDDIQWKTEEPECISKDDYIKRYGWLPNQASAYIICKDTILEISELTILENGLYSITISLNPDKDYAPFWYQREISTNSASLTKPVFSSISLEYVFDANWRVQEINTKEKYKVTPKVAPILVDCVTNIKEIFNYDEYEFDASAMDFFNQYKDLVPVGGDTEVPDKNTPLTYITGSLLGGSTKEKTFDLTIQIQDQVIKGKLLLNISNLNNVVVKVALGDLQVAYVDHEVFIDYGTIKIKCNIDEASTIVEPLLKEILLDSNHTSGSSNSSLDVGQIMNDINAAVVTETETAVQLDLTLNLMGLSLPLTFNIDRSIDGKGTETLELKSIQSNLKLAQNDISIQIQQNSQVTFEPLDGEYDDLNQIDFLIEDVTQLLKNKKFSVAFSASYESYQFSGILRVGLKEDDPLQILLAIENKAKEVKESFLVTYQKGIFYVDYQQIKLKLTTSEFSEFIKKYLPDTTELPDFEISQMMDWVLTLDLKTIFQEVSIKENEVFVSLNLSAFLKDLEDFHLQIVDTEEGFSLKSNLYDIILNVDTTTDYTIEFDSTAYVEIRNYLELVDYLTNTIYKKSLGIYIESTIQYEEYSIGLKGDIQLYLKNTTYTVEGNLVASYLDKQIDVDFVIFEKDVYVSVLGTTFKINLDTISTTIAEITTRLGVELSSIDVPQIGLTEVFDLVSSLKLGSSSIEVDFSSIFDWLGVVGVSFSLGDTTLEMNVENSLVHFVANVTPIESKELEIPTEYYDEKDLLNVIDYVEDILVLINQKHGLISFSGVYEDVQVSGNVYLDWKDTLQAQGSLKIIYEGQTFVLDLIYCNHTVYIAYENIKLKINETTIKEEVLDKLPPFEFDLDEILTKVQEVVQKITISEDKLGIYLNLGSFISGMRETEIFITNTDNGFDITTDLYDLAVRLDVTTEIEIEVDDNEYSAIEGYKDLVKYILSLMNKESIAIDFTGTFYLDELSVELNGTMEFMYNSNTSAYEIFASFEFDFDGNIAQIELTYIDNKIYLKLYDSVIELSIDDLHELISVIEEKFNLSPSQDLMDFPFDQITTVVKGIFLYESSIQMNLSNYVSLLTNLVFSYIKKDNGYEFELNQENLFDIKLSLQPIAYKEIEAPQATLYKNDVLNWIDTISYVMELVKGNAIHFEITDAVLNVALEDKNQEVKINGSVDILWNETGYQIAGNLTISGLGILANVGILVEDNTLYFTISNQTICLKLDEINEFILEAMEILSPMVSLEVSSLSTSNSSFDLKDFGLVFTSGSIRASLEQFVGKTCEVLIPFCLVDNRLSVQVNVSYDNLVQLDAPIIVSASEANEICLPSTVLTKEDILEILTYVVEAYELSLQKEFTLSIETVINTDGNVVAQIEGTLYLNLLENQEFDARLTLIVHEYQDEVTVAWHQLDVQVISLTTMNTLDPSVGMAMMYATYGNNPDDLSAVVKVKSTYKGIEDLIQSVLRLMDLDIPALNGTTDITDMDIRSLIDYIHVGNHTLSIGIEANSLFAAMQDERKVMNLTLTKNEDSKVDGILASDVYVSYTNTLKYMKLDQIEVKLLNEKVNFTIPTLEELSNYYDISEISNLFEALYHNALEKNFEISGTVTLTAASIININIPILLKINVDENGAPIIYVHLDMSNIGVASLLGVTKKQIYFYYKDSYVYIHRDDAKNENDRKIKIHYTEFMNDIVYYLMDYAMGLPDSVISLINKTPEGDGFVDASKCLNSISIGKDQFEFDLNMQEIADNNDLGKLLISLASKLVATLDEQGNKIYVPMIYQIPKFEFVAVNVINLHSTDLTLSNIKQDETGDYAVYDVSLDELDSYLADFNASYNADEEYIYSNGAWVSNGKIKHNVVYNMSYAGSKVKRYAEGELLDFPSYVNNLIPVDVEGQTKYYQLLGWYYDNSYLNPVESVDQMYMGNRAKVYYAKIQEITVMVSLDSLFDEPVTLTYYEGYDFAKEIEDLYSTRKLDGVMYKFAGIVDSEGELVDVNSLSSGEYAFTICWEEVHYSFYAIYDGNEKLLEDTSEEVFLLEDYSILRNDTYFIYSNLYLTPQILISKFGNAFVINDEEERFEINLYALTDSLFDDYETIVFSTTREEFNSKDYYGFFIPKNQEVDTTSLLPSGSFEPFEINAWVTENKEYYSLEDIKHISGSHTLSSYISTKLSYFEFETTETGATISAYTGTASTVIFPEYALLSGKYVPVVAIKELEDASKEKCSAFTGTTTIRTLVFNESLSFIGSNAFKNCDGIEDIYFPSSLLASAVAYDAFFFVKTGSLNFEKARDEAKKITFHCSETQATEFNLLACKYNGSERHYGKNEAGFLGAGRADLSNSFAQENVCIFNISNSIIKNM